MEQSSVDMMPAHGLSVASNGEQVPWPEANIAVPGPTGPAPAVEKNSTVVAEAIENLLLLIPGQSVAARLSDGRLGMVLNLDADTWSAAHVFLGKLTRFLETQEPPPAPPPITFRVLIVEDDAVARLVLRRILEQLPGCHITDAANGQLALEALERDLLPDLCISNLTMPVMDGLQLLQRIRSDRRWRDLEVLLCSASSDRDLVVKAAELNVSGYLVKPFIPANVLDQVRGILDQGLRQQALRIENLQSALGLDSATCAEVVQKLTVEIRDTVTHVRGSLAQGRKHAVGLSLNALKSACSLIHDNPLLSTIQSINDALDREDLTSVLAGLDGLENESIRISRWAAKISALAFATPTPAPDFTSAGQVFDQLQQLASIPEPATQSDPLPVN